MNMTSVLHRRSKPDLATRPVRRLPSSAPPAPQPPGGDDGRASWPTGARVLVAILLAATVSGAVGTTAALTSSDDGAGERQLQERVTILSQERDNARDVVDELDDALTTARAQLATARADGDELADRLSGLEEQVATLTQQRDAARETATELTATIDELEDRNDVLDAALVTANRRVADAVAERDGLAELFPIAVDGSLADDVELVGDHDVELTQIHCAGLASCGTVPAFDEMTVGRTPQGHLLLDIPGYVAGGFSRVGGALHMVAHSTTAIPACAGVPRQAEITMTLYPAVHRIASDGVAQVTGVAGVMTVEAPATGGCPAALAFYGVELG